MDLKLPTCVKKCKKKKKRSYIRSDSINCFTDVSGDVMTVASGVSVKFTCSGPADTHLPTWFVNGTVAVSDGHICYRSTYKRRPGELNATMILMINGNNSCYTFNIYCRIFRESEFLYIHNTTLVVQG